MVASDARSPSSRVLEIDQVESSLASLRLDQEFDYFESSAASLALGVVLPWRYVADNACGRARPFTLFPTLSSTYLVFRSTSAGV